MTAMTAAENGRDWYRYLALDSQLLRRKVARLLIDRAAGALRLPCCLAQLAHERFKLIYWRVLADDLALNVAAERNGGQRFNQQIRMECRQLAAMPSKANQTSKATQISQADRIGVVDCNDRRSSEVVIRTLSERELRGEYLLLMLPSLHQLADRLLARSHLALDPRLPPAGVREIYRVWLLNSIRGLAAKQVLAAEYCGQIVGIITLSWPDEEVGGVVLAERGDNGEVNKHERVGEIGLLAVAQEMQGRHIASSLLDHALSELDARQCAAVELVTQADNLRAVNLYRSRGFEITAHYHYYHFHY